MPTPTDNAESTGGLRQRLLSFRVLREVSIIVGAYFVYMMARRFLIPDIEAEAFANGIKVVNFELSTGLLLEPSWQAWALENSTAMVIMFNWIYVATFIPVLAITAFLVYVKDRGRYFYYRNVWLVSFVLALLIFVLFPLAPPRFLPEYGYVDAIQKFGPTWYGGSDMARAVYYNVYAAMPSLHFGWTLLFGILYIRMGPLPLRVWGVLYPTVTFFAITITGNHYIMDAVGGLGVAVASYASYEALRQVKPLVKTPLRPAAVGMARAGTTAWAAVAHLGFKAPAFKGRTATRPRTLPNRGLLLRWKVTLLVTAVSFKSHPWVERTYSRIYARKWKTGLPGS